MILAIAARLTVVEAIRCCANDLVPEWTLYSRGVRLDLGRSLRDLVRLRAAACSTSPARREAVPPRGRGDPGGRVRRAFASPKCPSSRPGPRRSRRGADT